jgi:catechol 2,3-dioxygenase-like lactoylglutathione lyase family enzyme
LRREYVALLSGVAEEHGMKEAIRAQLNLPKLDQVGFVVRNLEQMLLLYEPLFGPFSRMDPGPMMYDYRGAQEECTVRLAFGRSGDVEIELIEWVSGGCPHKEFLDAGREGMHHLRFIVDDIDTRVAAARAAGYEAIWSKRFAEGLAVAYLERPGDPLVIEFFENHRGTIGSLPSS